MPHTPLALTLLLFAAPAGFPSYWTQVPVAGGRVKPRRRPNRNRRHCEQAGDAGMLPA